MSRFFFFFVVGASPFLAMACIDDVPAVQIPMGDGGLDGAILDGSTGSDSAPAPLCDPKKPFGAPVAVGGGVSVLGSNDYEARLTPEETTMYFASDRGGADKMYTASRLTKAEPFSNVTELVVSGAIKPSGPSPSADQLMLVFQQNPPMGVVQNIALATRGTTFGDFSMLTTLTNVTAQGGTSTPYLLPDKSAIYYTSIMGGFHIRESLPVNGGTQFGEGADVVGVASANDDTYPVVTPDNLTIFWATSRLDGVPVPQGNLDIWVAHRTSRADTFSGAAVAPELNSAQQEYPTWISPDGCVIYLSSSRPAGEQQHIYRAQRPL